MPRPLDTPRVPRRLRPPPQDSPASTARCPQARPDRDRRHPARVTGTVGGNLVPRRRAAGVPAPQAAEFAKPRLRPRFRSGMSPARPLRPAARPQPRRDRRDETGGLIYARCAPSTARRRAAALALSGPPDVLPRRAARAREKGLIRTPVDGAHETSGFGLRFHPILGYSRMHQGIDFGAPTGVADHGGGGGQGDVRRAGTAATAITSRSPTTPGLTTAYGHMSRFAVKPGQTVAQGQVIGSSARPACRPGRTSTTRSGSTTSRSTRPTSSSPAGRRSLAARWRNSTPRWRGCGR